MMNDTMVKTLGQAAGYENRFIDMMIPHHEGAIKVAEDAQSKANHPEIKTMAQNMILAQRKEIAQLEEWRKQWYGHLVRALVNSSTVRETIVRAHGQTRRRIAAGHACRVRGLRYHLSRRSRPDRRTVTTTKLGRHDHARIENHEQGSDLRNGCGRSNRSSRGARWKHVLLLQRSLSAEVSGYFRRC